MTSKMLAILVHVFATMSIQLCLVRDISPAAQLENYASEEIIILLINTELEKATESSE